MQEEDWKRGPAYVSLRSRLMRSASSQTWGREPIDPTPRPNYVLSWYEKTASGDYVKKSRELTREETSTYRKGKIDVQLPPGAESVQLETRRG